MSVIEHDHWVCPRCDSVDGPTSGNLCDVCAYDDGATQEVVGLVSADAYRGAVDLLREALHLNVQAALPPEWTERARRVVGPSGGGQ